MASTYIVNSFAVPFATNQHLLTLFNPAASGKILRVYRIWVENNSITAVTGVNPLLKLYRCTAASSGVIRYPVTYRSGNTALGTVAAGSKQTVTVTSLFRNCIISNDEPVVNTSSCDEWQQFIAVSELWNGGTRNTNLDQIVCREGQGITIQNITATTVSWLDCFIEFTVE